MSGVSLTQLEALDVFLRRSVPPRGGAFAYGRALDVLFERLDRGRWPRDAGSVFDDYAPPPFLRPFDLAWFGRP